jgi:hypothetical protein
MNLSQYCEQFEKETELNKNNPDYQLENFWFILKRSMINFYESIKLKHNVHLWSNELDKYKKLKEYYKIEENIKNYISIYAIDIMKYDNISENYHCKILMTNIKRWAVILEKFNFSNTKNYNQQQQKIILLFEGFNIVKNKNNKKLYQILQIFKKIDFFVLTDFSDLIFLSLQLNQHKILDCLYKIMGNGYIYSVIKTKYPDFVLLNNNICSLKICNLFQSFEININ